MKWPRPAACAAPSQLSPNAHGFRLDLTAIILGSFHSHLPKRLVLRIMGQPFARGPLNDFFAYLDADDPILFLVVLLDENVLGSQHR